MMPAVFYALLLVVLGPEEQLGLLPEAKEVVPGSSSACSCGWHWPDMVP